MVVEEAERGPEREGVEPQGDLGQLGSQGVEVDAVDAPFKDVPLEQVDVG